MLWGCKRRGKASSYGGGGKEGGSYIVAKREVNEMRLAKNKNGLKNG